MSDKKDLLIELGTEDLPARLLLNLANDFTEKFNRQIESAELSFSTIHSYCTPRRLAIVVENLDSQQQNQQVEKKGPVVSAAFDDDNNPTQAAIGFARSCGVDVNQLELDKTGDEPRLVFCEQRAGLSTIELIPEMLKKSVETLSTPKSMRWNETEAEFIRPVRWLLVLFGEEAVKAILFGQVSNNVTYGHRFHHPDPIVIKHASKYKQLLQSEGYVIADFEERQQKILRQIEELATKVEAKPAYTQELLNEITSLVEWPHALIGEFDKRFLKVHKEVLISTMQDNQKYIPLLDEKDLLIPKFIIISNIDSSSPDVVKKGNEKVIVPRFEDAMFFWDRDRKLPLEKRKEALKGVVFEKQLGSLFDKAERITALSNYLCGFTGANIEHTTKAAELSKCDLLTEMVGEFPKLQGVIGRQLALMESIPKQAAYAIEQQYLPRHAGDMLPRSKEGQTLAIADRLDSLVGIFAIGKKPTGLKDPYGLRRISLAILKIIIANNFPIDLYSSLEKAASLFPKNINATAVVEEVFDYMFDRLRSYFLDQNVKSDVIDSVLANRPKDPNDIASRIKAISNFRKLPDAESLAIANKRIRNILKDTDRNTIGQVQTNLFKEEAESVLHNAIEQLSDDVENLFVRHEYEQALSKLANLRQPVDTFFDDVMVMDEDEKLKSNRIALLAKIDSLFMHVADFSRLQS